MIIPWDKFEQVLDAKHDKSWERYCADWPEIRDRYDVTAALVEGSKALDIGCGEGSLAYILAYILGSRYIKITGVDASITMIERAKELFGNLAHFQQEYAENLPFENGEFNTVILGQTLEHVNNLQDTVREALRCLKPGGRLIVNVPATDKTPHGNHLRVFATCEEMMSLFDGIEWQGYGRMYYYWFAWGKKL